ncbi:hypothetical protein ACIQPP_05440 [Streptomyces violaceusniger]|uniref:hypothetical protein n=1 Tax=Streptomyces violaceusniger TaxID=68280 RepID=UPI0009960878|nr:hypothetical protein [Streptomyces hygroscopicus]AQW55264.1 hypothetical protein SHXM_08727 [Streptomyces hygroscopicus]
MTDDRRNAASLARAARTEIDRIPIGHIKTDVLLAHSAKAAALAGIGIVHALLDIANAIRSATDRP